MPRSNYLLCQSAQAPAWCRAPLYDPEGALATSNSIISVWIGLHFGHVLKHGPGFKHHAMRMKHWASAASLYSTTKLMMWATPQDSASL